eukprot:gene24351-26263_t
MPGHKSTAMKQKSSAKRSRSAKKMTPAGRYLRFELTNSAVAGTETSHFIDLAQAMSKTNRRLYRQGRDYHVKKVTIVSKNTPNGDNRVSFSTVNDGWVSQMAWKRGFDVWNRQNREAMQNTAGDIKATWSDFKVYLSLDHKNGTKLQPLDNGGNSYNSGDWDYTDLVSPDGTTGADEFTLHLLGNHSPVGGPAGSWVSVGLIKSYGESRATVQATDPLVPGDVSDDPLVNVFDYGTTVDEVLDKLEGDNDAPPYGVYNYPGDDANAPKPIVKQDTTIVDGRATVGGFMARCGLIEIETSSPLPSDVYSVLVELAPGNYRGVKADVI